MVFLYVGMVGLLTFFTAISLKKPSHNRIWELGQEKLPKINIDGNLVTVKNLRDFDWKKEGTEINYIKDTFELDKMVGVDVVISHFSKFEGMAHIFLTFRFDDDKNLAMSIETRREDGEEFQPFIGLFNKFEIIYVVATEKDLIGVRTNVRNDGEGERVYLYPTIASPEKSRELFKLVVEDVNKIYDKPVFYNTLFHNCTNAVTRRVEEISPVKFPVSYKSILPGYFDKILYDMKLVSSNGLNFEEFKERNFINNNQVDNHSDGFSQQIRKHFDF